MNEPIESEHGPERNNEQKDVFERLDAIEHRLTRLEALLNASEIVPQHSPSREAKPGKKADQKTLSRHGFEVSEQWLQRLGIVLLLFGLAFLFKYSIDRAWLTPWVRVGIVLAVGCLLLGLAWRIVSKRRLLARTLAGGGVACIYGALYATFEFYHLIGIALAFSGMLLATVGAFALSLSSFGAPMAVLGTIGGFSMPFVLYTGRENVLGLLIYTTLLTLGSLIVYLRHRWRSLLWSTVIGTWAVVLTTYITSNHILFGLPDPDAKLPLRVSTIGFWLLFALLPLRGWRRGLELPSELALVISSPIVGLILCEKMWSFGESHWAVVWSSVAIIYSGIAAALHRMPTYSWLHMLMAVVLLNLGLWHVLGEHMLLLSVSSEAIVLLLLAHRMRLIWPSRLAHTLFAFCLYTVFWRLLHHHPQGIPLINRQALTDLDVLGLTVIAAWFSGRSGRDAYCILIYAGLLALAYREFSVLANGQAWVSAIWAMCGIFLLLASLRNNQAGMRRLALGTLMLVALKLLLIDLSHIEAIWRILISVGLGGIFLSLSYVLPAFNRRLPAGKVVEFESEVEDHDLGARTKT